MRVLMVMMILAFAGCGPDIYSTTVVDKDVSILNVWKNNNPASVLATLDLSQLTLNVQMSSSSVANCPVPAGGDASGTDAPQGFHHVTKGNLYMDGSTTYGILQFGKQPHDNSQSGICYVIGQEAYTYSVSGKEMTLCDIKYSVCSVYSL